MTKEVKVIFVHGIKTDEKRANEFLSEIRQGHSTSIEYSACHWCDLKSNQSPITDIRSLPWSREKQVEAVQSRSGEAVMSLAERDHAFESIVFPRIHDLLGNQCDLGEKHEEMQNLVYSFAEKIGQIGSEEELRELSDIFLRDHVAEGAKMSPNDLNEISTGSNLARGEEESNSRGVFIHGAATLIARFAHRIFLPNLMLFVADIFDYLSNKTAILERLERLVLDDSKTILVGHSLGGVICADYLNETKTSGSEISFVSVGSQVGYLCDLNYFSDYSESSLSRIRWKNIYSSRDFLSSRTSGYFANSEDIEALDVPLFPESHSHYFLCETFHACLSEIIGDSQ